MSFRQRPSVYGWEQFGVGDFGPAFGMRKLAMILWSHNFRQRPSVYGWEQFGAGDFGPAFGMKINTSTAWQRGV